MSGHGLEIVALNLCLVPAGLGVLALVGHRGRWRPGLAYMTGIAAVGIVLTLLLVAGAGLEVWQFLLVCGLFAVPALRGPWPRLARPSRPPLPALIGIALVVGFLALLAVDAAHQPLWSFDSWSLWTDKAKGIVLLGGLDPTFVRGTVSANYPLLVPALEAVDLRAVGMDTVAVHMQFWCFAAGTVWALADLLRERVRPVVLWCLLPALVVAPAVGIQTASALADVPLGCFVALTGVSALLWLRTGASAHLVLAGLFAAAGVATKTEGALYAAAIAAALLPLALRHSRRSALAVGVVCAAVLVTALPWSVWSIRHHLASWYSGATDLGAAPAHVHVSRAFVAAPDVAREIADPTSWLLLAPIALGAIVLAWRAGRRDECVLAAVPPVIAFAGFVWIYWHTPYDLHVHLANSARRVIIGIDLYLAALAPLLVETALRRER